VPDEALVRLAVADQEPAISVRATTDRASRSSLLCHRCDR
jgi:hypothetical protein